jgi:hypothetical protein
MEAFISGPDLEQFFFEEFKGEVEIFRVGEVF